MGGRATGLRLILGSSEGNNNDSSISSESDWIVVSVTMTGHWEKKKFWWGESRLGF